MYRDILFKHQMLFKLAVQQTRLRHHLICILTQLGGQLSIVSAALTGKLTWITREG
jgi:hypothetical protein